MAKDRNGSLHDGENSEKEEEARKSKRKVQKHSDSEDGGRSLDGEEERKYGSKSEKKKKKRDSSSKRKSRRNYSDEESSYSSDGDDLASEDTDSGSGSESESSEYSSEDSEEERRRKKRRERRRRREREEERERKRRKREKERKRRKERHEEKRRRKKKKEKEKEKGKKGAVTNSWGKYGIVRDTDMWNKRPEFTAWLAEVKQVNLESLPNWEEKQMFKVFMEDHNTATFPSKKYYGLDAYYRRKMEKERKKGFKKVMETERTVFNDEEQRRQELLQEREKHKEEQVEALKCSMRSGMAQAMKEQAQLREEMAYQYKIGNFEAAAAIQKRLDPDIAM